MSLSPTTTVEKIKKTYREVDEETEDVIQLQMEYALFWLIKTSKTEL